MLEALAGLSPRSLAFLHAHLKSEIRVKCGLRRFLPAILSGEYADSQVELVPWQGSGDIAARSRSNCLARDPSRSRTHRRRRVGRGDAAVSRAWSGCEQAISLACGIPCKIEFPMATKLSHYDDSGHARAWSMSPANPANKREAEATAFVVIKPEVLKRAAAKSERRSAGSCPHRRHHGRQTHLGTHPPVPRITLSHVDVEMRLCENGVAIATKVVTTAETGVEMEALVAASVAALTLYDMLKGLDKEIEIREIVLQRKSGGKSGEYRRAK